MALVMWSMYEMRRIRRKDILSKASTLSCKARVRADVSEPYNETVVHGITNGHISTTGDPKHFMFGSRVRFSGSADRMALFPVTSNPSG